jgi:hypothetical protein
MNAARATLLALVTVAGCRHAPWIEPSGSWRTVSSTHFNVHTDSSQGQYEPLVAQLEATYATLSGTFFNGIAIPKVEAILFANRDDFEEIIGPGMGGVFVPRVGSDGVLVLPYNEWTRALNETAAHELTHRFTRSAYPRLPRWLDEGLATYLGSVDIRDTSVRFGAPPLGSSLEYEVGGTVPLENLIASSRNQLYGPGAAVYYTTAWALVHYLINGERGARYRRFPAFLAAVNQAGGTPSATRAVLQAIYPEQTPAQLDEAVTVNAVRHATIGVEQLLVMPLEAAPAPAISAQPADRIMIREFCRALKQRRRRRP